MNRKRIAGVAAAGIVSMAALAGCSSTSTSSADIDSLDARVTTLESQVAGLEAIVGQAIIADPAAQIAELESRIQGLQKELNSSQAQAADVESAVSAEVAAAEAALADAQKAVDDANAAADDAREAAIADAEARVADAQAAVEALKAKVAEAIGARLHPRPALHRQPAPALSNRHRRGRAHPSSDWWATWPTSTRLPMRERCPMFDDNGSFLLALFEFFLFFAWLMCLFWVFGDIFRSRDLGGGAKTFWVIFVIFLPWLGVLVYLIARGKGMQERARSSRRGDAGCADGLHRVGGRPRAVPRPTRSRRRSRCSIPARSHRRSSRAEGEGARRDGHRGVASWRETRLGMRRRAWPRIG